MTCSLARGTPWTVVELRLDETFPLRRAVLRRDTPTDDVRFDEDGWPGAHHLGVRDGGVLVGTSTWVPRPHAGDPELPAVQLRGMATVPSHQGRGIGAALVAAGCARAAAAGVELVWANARDAALDFYRREGFVVAGAGFVDRATQLPHHVVLRRLQESPG